MSLQDWNREQERMAREQKEQREKTIAEMRETLHLLDSLDKNDGWQWLKRTLLAKSESKRMEAMGRENADQMARDLGYLSALLDVVKLPEDHAKVLRTQLVNSKL